MNPSSSVAALTEALVERGMIHAETRPPATTSTDRPWFISMVLGIAGWLAGLFALLFVNLLFKPESAAEFSVAGIVMLASAYGLYAVDRESAFFDQLALALSIAGQLALSVAAWEVTESAGGTAALVGIMQGVLLFVLPNRLAKLLSAFFACIAWALAVRFAWWGEWSFDSTRTQAALVPALVGWLVIWIPVIVLTHVLIAREPHWMASRWRGIARPALTGLILSLAVGTWVSEPLGSLQFWAPPGPTYTNWLTLWPLLAVGASLFACTSAFRLRHRGLIGFTIAGAMLHIVQFYFLLGATLLMKSLIMLAVGAVLLFAATFLRRQSIRIEGDAP
jgi:hypothetical protein